MSVASSLALADAKKALGTLGIRADLAVGEDLFAAGNLIADSAQLRGILFDSSLPINVRQSSVDRVFGGRTGSGALTILKTVVSSRWSTGDDAIAAIEELGIRAIAVSASGTRSLENELFAVSTVVSSNPELELTLGSKLVAVDAKIALISRLLGSKAAQQTVVIVTQLVRHTRGRGVIALVERAASIVADQGGAVVATARVATRLSTDRIARLEAALSRTYGRVVTANVVVDPTAVGGVQLRLGDDVIDGSIASRFSDLRLLMA